MNDRLAGYVEVKDRIAQFYAKHPDGRLVTSSVSASSDPDGKPRVWVEAKAYRTPDDPQPAVGWSWMELPGRTPYTNGSELENTETSAWGRAIGALGIGIDKSIASAQEFRNKEGEPAAPAPDPIADGLFGTAEKGTGDADFEMRQTSVGPRIAFRLTEGRTKLKVEAVGALAELISEYRAGIEAFRVQAWGEMREESFTPKDATRPITYRVMRLSRLKVGHLDLTEPEPDDEPPAPDDAQLALVGAAS
jgi:hypothetical protein